MDFLLPCKSFYLGMCRIKAECFIDLAAEEMVVPTYVTVKGSWRAVVETQSVREIGSPVDKIIIISMYYVR